MYAKKSDENMKRCSVCKSLAYCSKDHQKQDWKQHKNICNVIAEADTALLCDARTIEIFRDFRNFNVKKSVLWQNKLGRSLYNFEEQIWMFPRVCVVCFSKNVLFDCHNCLNVSYCSEEHKDEYKEQHLKYCESLRLCMDIDLYYFHEKYKPDSVNIKVFDDEVNIFPNNLEELMIMYEGGVSTNDSDEKIQFVIKSDFVAPVASILYGLEKSGLLKDRIFPKQILTVHIVGADITEMCWLWKIITELPFHWIKNICALDIFVVGPELGHNGITEKFGAQLCENCRMKNLKTRIIFHSSLYHEVVDSLKAPDIVVTFNSGLHEFCHNSKSDDWNGSINSLVKYPDVPLILTAYTMDEIKQDINIVKINSEKYVKTVLEPERNPFSNMRPIRDWETENVPVFYINGYIAILSAAMQS
ncbi:hypothetical protein NQ314_002255 [Rhamnusium bicolor]|uniref:MYND-type domain-containing protein n=1 Tax=Rhamnusium bicolor TaxID=1586634 RepID=A0AAV8ZS69_9CUCU|nr:hypothetical protein NQ314_002255 [Rhamnusium bicolor]